MFIQSKGFTKLLSVFIGANLYGGWLNVSFNVKQPIIIGVPIVDHKKLEELNIVQSQSGYLCKKANNQFDDTAGWDYP